MSHKSVVNCQWLAQQLDNPEIVVVDCRFQLTNPEWGYDRYCLSHIPGAAYLDLNRHLSSPVGKHGGRHPLPDIDSLALKLASLGIVRQQTMVVAYDDSRFAFAARLWWLLRYLGHDRVALLDGGWNAWQQAGYPVNADIPEPRTGLFTPQLHSEWLVDIEAVKTSRDLSNFILIDSRDRDRYAGEREPIDPIAGHIPGAVNSPWQLVSDERGYLLPLEAQQQLWFDYQQASEIIVYCGSGVTACVNLFSLELAGIDRARLYLGGWSDWCSYL
jgi:thiosulfate/3-mercaptopyruvate sulfurtransferase